MGSKSAATKSFVLFCSAVLLLLACAVGVHQFAFAEPTPNQNDSASATATGMANGPFTLDSNEVPDAVAKNVQTGKEYATLAEAHNEVEEGQTIQLLRNIDLGSESFTTTKTYTLDLVDFEIKSTGHVVVVEGSGTLTITGNGAIHEARDSGWNSALYIGRNNSRPTVVIKSGTIRSNHGYAINNYVDSTVIVEGGHILGSNYTAVNNFGTLTIRGDDTLIEGFPYAVQNASGFGGKISIEGGTIIGNLAIRATGHGTIDISGGTLEGRIAGIGLGHTDSNTYSDVVTFKEGSTSVLKAPANKTFRIDKQGPTVNIYGGKFSDQVGNGDYYNRKNNQYLMREEGGDLYVLTPATFKEIVWTGKGTNNPTAKAVFTYGDNESPTQEIDCEIIKEDHAKGTTYTAMVSAEKSPDGEEHSDSYTVYRKFNLFVQGVQVTGENCDDILGNGTAKFDPEAAKITLNNANIEISRREHGDDGNEYGIRSNLGDGIPEFSGKPLTIELIGTNTISDSSDTEGTKDKYGVVVTTAKSVTYTGGGSLNVNMQNANTAQHYRGIEHHQPTTIDGVEIAIDIDGSVAATGISVHYSNLISLVNGAKVVSNVAAGYALDNNVQDDQNLSVAEDCTFEATTGGPFGAFHANGWIQVTDATKELGALVNQDPAKDGAKKWDGEAVLADYKYILIPYEHQWGEWVETKEPTCTEPGEETRECTSCDEVETREIEALGHAWGKWEVTKQPTYTEEGEETRICSRNGEIETRAISKLPSLKLKTAMAPGQKYTGKAHKPAITVKDENGNTVPASAYTVKYTNNVNVGTATATVTAKADSGYTGTVKALFLISAVDRPVYMLYNTKTGEYLYSAATPEVNALNKKPQWTNKGVAWYAPFKGVPVYRLVKLTNSDHLYTTSVVEKNKLLKSGKWRADFGGVPAFYSGGGKTITRMYSEARWASGKIGSHRFGLNASGVSNLKKSGWVSEGTIRGTRLKNESIITAGQ